MAVHVLSDVGQRDSGVGNVLLGRVCEAAREEVDSANGA